MSFKITTHQKSNLRRLLQKAELDPRTVTFAYRQLKVPEEWIGGSVDRWLDSLGLSEASDVIKRLMAMTSDDD